MAEDRSDQIKPYVPSPEDLAETALFEAWEKQGWPKDGENNEFCVPCGREDMVKVRGIPPEYDWTCPGCGYEHRTVSDHEVSNEMADSWAMDAGTSCPALCPHNTDNDDDY